MSIKFNSTSLHKLSRFENNPTKGQWRYSCHVPLRRGKHKAVAALCRGKGGPCPPVAANEVRVVQCGIFHWLDHCAPGQRGGCGQQSGGEGGLRSEQYDKCHRPQTRALPSLLRSKVGREQPLQQLVGEEGDPKLGRRAEYACCVQGRGHRREGKRER